MRHSTRVRPPPASPAKKEKMLRGAGNEQKIVSLNEIKKKENADVSFTVHFEISFHTPSKSVLKGIFSIYS
jgi:hypothetical protein